MKLVYIEWLDHVSFEESTWRTEEDYDELEPATCKTIGWIMKETDDMLIVVQTIHQAKDGYDDKYCGDMCILKGCITSMKELKL